ncbi:MAG: glycosyltransferase family 39 protein [bacterium]
MPETPSRRLTALTAVAVAAAFLFQVVWGLGVHGGTCDELGAHLPAGILHWKSGHATSGLANPPLGQLLVAAGPVLTGAADHPLRDDPGALLPARLPVVLLGLLTVLLTATLAGRLAGPRAALAAGAAAALSPDVVAHSGLATLDMPVTAFAALASLLAWRWVRERETRLLVGFAVAIGAACLTKSTALHILFALALGGALLPGSARERFARGGALLGTGAASVLASAWLAYGLGPVAGILPAEYVTGLGGKLGQGAHGHFSYLLGHRSSDGFAAYYLVALGAKTPIALALAAIIGARALMRRRLTGDVAGFAAFALLPAVWLLVALSLLNRVHIGVRHLLPAFPAGLALAGAGWSLLTETRFGGSRFAGRVASVAIAAWAIVAAFRIAPDDLAYFNELAGGPDRGDAILIDSNLDWGQDEARFREWARTRSVVVNPDRPAAGLVAANVNALRGIFAMDDLRLRWLRRLTPVRSFGHTFRVYDVSEAPLREAASRGGVAALDYAWWLVGVGRPSDALAALDGAASLRDDPTYGSQLSKVRAEALLALGRLPAARDAAARSDDVDLEEEIQWRERVERGTAYSAAEAARAIRALARRGHREEASRLGVAVFGMDPLATSGGGAPRWTEAGRLKALGSERAALEAVAHSLAADPTNDDALWLYGELVVRRKLGLSEYPLPDVDWSRVSRRSP